MEFWENRSFAGGGYSRFDSLCTWLGLSCRVRSALASSAKESPRMFTLHDAQAKFPGSPVRRFSDSSATPVLRDAGPHARLPGRPRGASLGKLANLKVGRPAGLGGGGERRATTSRRSRSDRLRRSRRVAMTTPMGGPRACPRARGKCARWVRRRETPCRRPRGRPRARGTVMHH